MKWIVCLVLWCAVPLLAAAQDEAWWRANVNWDGISPYQRYISFTPAGMGPNAIPVPLLRGGLVDSMHSISISAAVHGMKGDFAVNPSLYATVALVPNKISFDAWYVPVEWFRSSHAIKTQRRIFYKFYNNQWSTGDFILNTNIQLLRQQRHGWNAALRISYRFPTGGDVGQARYTDAPGYSFDVNWSRSLGNSAWRWKGMMGFYVWQMGNLVQQQNDAFLFGTGLQWQQRKTMVEAGVAGYLGYLETKDDRPVVLRLSFEQQWRKQQWFLRLQQGIQDFRYTSAELGCAWLLRPVTKQP